MYASLGCRLCKCTNLPGFAWVQAGSWIMAPALHAGRAHLKEQQVEDAILSIPSSSAIALSLSLSLSLGWEMAMVQIGKCCGRFGKRLFPPLTFSLHSLCVVINWRGHIQDKKQVSQEKCESLYAFSWYQHQLLSTPPAHSSLCAYSLVLYLSPSPLSIWLSGSALTLSLSSLGSSLSALCLLLDCLSVCLCLC